MNDFNVLCKILDENYPFWIDIEQAEINKEKTYKEYRDIIKNTKTDIDFFKSIGYFLSDIS